MLRGEGRIGWAVSYLGEGTRAANNASSHTTDGSHALSNALSLSLSLSPTLEPPTHTPHATLTHYEITRKRRTLFPCFVLHTPRPPPLVRTSPYSTRAPGTPSFSSQKTEENLPPNCTIGAISIRLQFAISMRLKKLDKIEKEERKRKRRRHGGGGGWGGGNREREMAPKRAGGEETHQTTSNGSGRKKRSTKVTDIHIPAYSNTIFRHYSSIGEWQAMDDKQWQRSTGLQGFAEKECKAIHEMMVIEFVTNYELDTNRSTVRGCNICLDKKVIMAVFKLPGEGSQPRLTRVENFDASLFFDADDPSIYVATQGFVIDKMRSLEDQIRFRALTEALVLKQVLKYTSASFLEAIQRALQGEAIDWASYYLSILTSKIRALQRNSHERCVSCIGPAITEILNYLLGATWTMDDVLAMGILKIAATEEAKKSKNSTEESLHCKEEEETAVEVQREGQESLLEEQKERLCKQQQQEPRPEVARVVKAEPEATTSMFRDVPQTPNLLPVEEPRVVEEGKNGSLDHRQKRPVSSNNNNKQLEVGTTTRLLQGGTMWRTSMETKSCSSFAEMERLAEEHKQAYILSEAKLVEEKKRNIQLLQRNEELVQELDELRKELDAVQDRATAYKRISKERQSRLEQLQHKSESDQKLREQLETDLKQRVADLQALKSEMLQKEELTRVHEYYAAARAQGQVQLLEKKLLRAQRQSMPAYEQLMAECGEFKLKALLYDALLLSISGEKKTQFVEAERHYQRWLDAERIRYSSMMNHILEYFAEEDEGIADESTKSITPILAASRRKQNMSITAAAAAATAVGAFTSTQTCTDLKQLRNPRHYPHRWNFQNQIFGCCLLLDTICQFSMCRTSCATECDGLSADTIVDSACAT